MKHPDNLNTLSLWETVGLFGWDLTRHLRDVGRTSETDLGQDELLHRFVPQAALHGPRADGTEASSHHRLLQKKKK